MSIQSRRNSLYKSSISIRTINNAATKFSAGLKAARKNADEIIKTTRQRHIFKSKLSIQFLLRKRAFFYFQLQY